MNDNSIFSPSVKRMLTRTPIGLWNSLALMIDGEDGDSRVMPRAELVAHLERNDLPELARDARTRRVPHGALLALVIHDDGPRLVVLFDTTRNNGRKR